MTPTPTPSIHKHTEWTFSMINFNPKVFLSHLYFDVFFTKIRLFSGDIGKIFSLFDSCVLNHSQSRAWKIG